MKTSLQVSAIACALSMSGCSTLQSWFPDKEKDYQFTTELPPLVIPPDLVQKPSLPTRATPEIAKTVKNALSDKALLEQVKPAFEEATKIMQHPSLSDAETEMTKNEIQLSLTHEKTPALNLNVPVARAWRIVGKALSRNNIETTKHDQENGQIYVQIANAKPQPEKSLWDNTVDVFNPFSQPEQKYVLQFTENNGKTAVTVLDEALQPISDDKLLASLFDSIKADLSK
ncbi:MAG: outer membrane protein assembly factor BamC [Methylococcales bacterium]|nr:outer membrane protein assembly factor BamC [Methylococcales bacterium]